MSPDAGGGAAGRLIELVDFDRPTGGSFIPMVRALLTEARSRGWKADAVVPPSAASVPWLDDLRKDGVEVHVAPQGGDLKLGRWLGDLIDKGPSGTVLHSHFHGFDEAGWLAARSRSEVTLVWHIHSVYSREPTRVGRAATKLALMGRRVDAMLCPAGNIVDSTVKRGAPRDRVHFEPSAIDLDSFPLASPGDGAEAKRSLGLDPKRPVIGHFGWHWHLKGGDVFLEAIKALVDEGEYDLIAAERGGRAEYLEYAAELGILGRLVILPPAQLIWVLHAAMDVLICSSRKEGMAYATLEALASGTPVVATDIPGHAYLAQHMDACVLTGHDPQEIATATAAMLARPEEQVVEEAAAARAWISENLDIRSAAVRQVNRFEELAERRRASASRA